MKRTIDSIGVDVYRVPTDAPESDGTLAWDSTTMVLVRLRSGDRTGLGWTYAAAAAGSLIDEKLRKVVEGHDALAVSQCRRAMLGALRNDGRSSLCAMAVAAVDCALWDLKSRLLDLPLAALLGQVHASLPAYGSGGFTSYDLARLQEQLGGWARQGMTRVKMKVGRDPHADPGRVRAAREAIGPDVELFVDANGAYSRKQALRFAEEYAQLGVRWFEEPVSSDDLPGLHLARDRAPAGMDVAAGEYGYTPDYFERMLAAEAVDCLQADATRCLGITGWMGVNALCDARSMPLSAHCAPSIHAHPGAAATRLRHIEYFHDHARIERMLFDGVLEPHDGCLWPDRSRPGIGLQFRRADAERYRVWP